MRIMHDAEKSTLACRNIHNGFAVELQRAQHYIGCIEAMASAEGNVVHLQRSITTITNTLLYQHCSLVFQPRQLVVSKRLLGVEALLRWQHPVYGEINATNIIKLAEKRRIIDHFSLYIINLALVEFKQLCNNYAGQPQLTLSVNITPLSLKHPEFLKGLIGLCNEHSIATSQLILDFPEHLVVASDAEKLIDKLSEYRQAGFKLALDDFGTAEATAPIIERLHLHELKVDVQVISAVSQSKEAELLAKAALRLAAHAGILTTAEGVENAATQALIAELGFDIMQGYALCKPLSSQELQAWCHEYQKSRNPSY